MSDYARDLQAARAGAAEAFARHDAMSAIEFQQVDARRRIKIRSMAPGTRFSTAEAQGRLAIIPAEDGLYRVDSQHRLTMPVDSEVANIGGHVRIEKRSKGFLLVQAVMVTRQDVGPELWDVLLGRTGNRPS